MPLSTTMMIVLLPFWRLIRVVRMIAHMPKIRAEI